MYPGPARIFSRPGSIWVTIQRSKSKKELRFLLTGLIETPTNIEMTRRYQRPVFEDALSAWKQVLKEKGFSTDIVWILEENLCFESDASVPEQVRLGFQTQFSP